MSLKWVADHFSELQIAIIAAAVVFGWLGLRNRGPKSQFKSREADRTDLDKIIGGPGLADAKMKARGPTLALPGIRLAGEPHEILGVRVDATESEIMKAYKDAIKQYHPDKIQGSAKDQEKFYQEASAKLNEAKEAMLKKVR